MPQLVYNIAPAVGYEGTVADSREGTVIVSRLCEGVVPVGLLCAPGAISLTGPPLATLSSNATSPGGVKALATASSPAADSEWVGVPIYDATRAPYDTSLGYSAYEDKKDVPVLIRGPINVKPEAGAISQQGDVYVRVAANGGLNVLGKFAPAAGAGLVLFPRGRFISGLMQGSLAILLIT